MDLPTYFSVKRNARLSTDLSLQIATRSHELTLGTVLQRAMQLPLGEARGYIRARSRPIASRQSILVFESQPPVTNELREQIVELALELIVHGVARDVMTARAARLMQPARAA
jgi:hypothetical protein